MPDDFKNMLSQLPPDIQSQFTNADNEVTVKEVNVTPADILSGKAPPVTATILPAGGVVEQNKVLADLSNLALGMGVPPTQTRPAMPGFPPESNGEVPPMFLEKLQQRPEVKVIKIHPILETIRTKLGIIENKIKKSKNIDGYEWGFRKLNSRESNLVVELISKDTPIESIGDSQFDNYIKAATLSLALRSVGDIPLYEVMGLDTSGFIITDKFNPPRDLKREASFLFMQVLLNSTDDDVFFDKLYKSYTSLIGDLNQLGLDSGKSAWSCPECGRIIQEVMRYDSDSREKPYYCKYDGSMLERMEVLDDNDSPLSLKKQKETTS